MGKNGQARAAVEKVPRRHIIATCLVYLCLAPRQGCIANPLCPSLSGGMVDEKHKQALVSSLNTQASWSHLSLRCLAALCCALQKDRHPITGEPWTLITEEAEVDV